MLRFLGAVLRFLGADLGGFGAILRFLGAVLGGLGAVLHFLGESANGLALLELLLPGQESLPIFVENLERVITRGRLETDTETRADKALHVGDLDQDLAFS